MTEKEQAFQPLNVTSSDLHVISHVLVPYARTIHRSVASSSQRDALLGRIERLRERIATTRAPMARGQECAFDLSDDEVVVVDQAFTAFVVDMDQDVPPSAERDKVMRECEVFRSLFLSGRVPQDVASP
jgi:hypothetical protein